MSGAPVTDAGLPGWFGKVPNVGDFVSRRLPEAFIHEWDRWLEQGLALARAQHGATWLEGYLVAPIRRFWLAPGLLGEPGWAGLMMPSVDHVGRHFPLTIAQPVQALAVALAARQWYGALDGLARQVLDVDFTIGDLEQGLAQVARADPDAADDAAREHAHRLLTRLPGGSASVWWCDDADDADDGDSHYLCFKAMPPPAAFVSMMVVTT